MLRRRQAEVKRDGQRAIGTYRSFAGYRPHSSRQQRSTRSLARYDALAELESMIRCRRERPAQPLCSILLSGSRLSDSKTRDWPWKDGLKRAEREGRRGGVQRVLVICYYLEISEKQLPEVKFIFSK